jgi:D-sedoheptulose 7-phosphate isomerase
MNLEKSNYFLEYFETIEQNLKCIDSVQLQRSAVMVWETHQSGGKIIVVGNGGSAAIASHVAVDFTKAAGIRAINFNEADLITCLANDYGYENWIEMALEFYADKGDLVILISSSGNSLNIINGAKKAKSMNLSLITLSGFSAKNPLREYGDINLWTDSTAYNIVEMTHHVWLLAIIDYLIETKQII